MIRVGVIGTIGVGKSTLIKMIMGDIEFDSGTIHKNNKAAIGYLSQDVISDQSETLFNEMHNVFDELIRLDLRIKDLSHKLAIEPHNAELLEQYSKSEHIFKIKGGYEYLYKINLIFVTKIS